MGSGSFGGLQVAVLGEIAGATKRHILFSSDVLATITDGKVYAGNSSYSSDILFAINGYVTIVEFVAIWHAALYSY